MDQFQRRVGLLHRMAWACAALVLAITCLSAFVRLSKAGVGCEPWPQCQTQRAPATAGVPAPPESDAVVGARIAHRIVASSALLLIIAMVMVALARQPPLREPGRLVLALLALAVFLAALGRFSGDPQASAAVVLANLLGGMAMVGAASRLVLATGASAGESVGPRRSWVLAALALLALQLALGGLVSAGQLAARCDTSLLCQIHRIGALLTVLAIAAVAVVVWRQRPRVAAVLLLLVLAQATLGVAMLSMALPFPLALAHNFGAALLIAALATLL